MVGDSIQIPGISKSKFHAHVTSFFMHVRFTAAMLVYFNIQYSVGESAFTELWTNQASYGETRPGMELAVHRLHIIYSVPNEKVYINKTNWTPNQSMYAKTAKRAARESRKDFKM